MRRWTPLAVLLVACGGDAPSGVDSGVDGGAPITTCTADEACTDSTFCNGAERCLPDDPLADSRGCVAAAGPPCLAEQMCVEDGDSCATMCDLTSDADGDGVDSPECGGSDCDDADGNRYPGNAEVCDPDDHDEDCDPTTFGFRDQDMDGDPDAMCCNEGNCGTDCNDLRPGTHSSASEVCDDRDNDCDGMVDEDVRPTWTIDADGDGYGSSAAEAEAMVACMRPTGFVDDTSDCDDAAGSVNPGNAEVCDDAGLDDDCDGMVDEGCDCTAPSSRSCADAGARGRCAGGVQTCDPTTGTYTACSIDPIAEICNGEDDDCDGMTDDGVTVTCYADGDDDGYADTGASASQLCPSRPIRGGCPINTTNRAPIGGDIDCDDAEADVNPGRIEVCNTIDDDCDGAIDETLTVTCYADADGDTYSPTGATASPRCPQAGRSDVGGCPTGFTNRRPIDGADCNDTPPGGTSIHPGVAELCDAARVDENCNGTANEGCACSAGDPPISCGLPGRCASGTRTCDSASGSYGACSVGPVTEICNGEDDDCDGTVDDGFECTGTMTVTCTHPTCGTTGSRTCASCMLGACTAPESCNSCDDDNDGSVDETFLCTPGESGVLCTTGCMEPGGTGTCNSTCDGTTSCTTAVEVCNYCDDTDNGTFYDEHTLGSLTDYNFAPSCDDISGGISRPCGTAGDGHSCAERGLLAVPSIITNHDYNLVRVGSAQRVGYGTIDAFVTLRSTTGSAAPIGGWAVLLTTSGASFNIEPYGYSPTGSHGIAIEWDWNGNSNDIIRVRRLRSTGAGSVLGTGAVPATRSLSSGHTTRREQRLHVRYQPGVFGGPGERLEVRLDSASATPIITLYGVTSSSGTMAQRVLAGELTSGGLAYLHVGGDADNWTTAQVRSWIGVLFDFGPCLFASELAPTSFSVLDRCP